MAVLPLVALAGGREPGQGASERVRVAALTASPASLPTSTGAARWRRLARLLDEPTTDPPTSTSVAPTPSTEAAAARAATTTAAPVARSKVAAAAVARPVRPAPTTSTVPPTTVPRPSQTGPASWYPAAAGTCAHQTLPFGTVVTIVDIDTGRTATCTVDDRGPYEGDRIIDLSPDVFGQLAPTSDGVINVRITW